MSTTGPHFTLVQNPDSGAWQVHVWDSDKARWRPLHTRWFRSCVAALADALERATEIDRVHTTPLTRRHIDTLTILHVNEQLQVAGDIAARYVRALNPEAV